MKEVDAKGNTTTYTYDKDGNKTSKTDAKGSKTSYEYDADGNLTKVEDAIGHTSEYSYDKIGHLVKEIRRGKNASNDQTTTYQYDKNAQLIKETAKDGTSTLYKYDKAGNLSKKIYSDNRSVTYDYDSNNRLTTMTDWNGSTKYTYNALGQATKVTDSGNQVVKYTWTKNGKKQSMTYPDGKVVQYAYDVAGNLAKVTGTKNGVTTYNYDDKNRLTSKNLPNGTESTYSYDSIGQLTGRKEKTGSTTNGSYTYQYDANGNRTKETKVKAGGTETSTYAYDDLNQLIQTSDTKSYSYDARGNLSTKKVNGITKEAYTFDSTNMLTKVKNTNKNTESKFGYDGAGNRMKKTVSKNNKVVSKKSYVIDTMSSYQDIIAEADTLTGNETDFTYGLGLVSVETGKGISYYRIDEKNSVEEIQNNSGTVKAEIGYDEFGNVENPDDIGTTGNIFSYTGHVYEAESSQLYVKARYYDSETGRFISEDSDLGDIEELVTRNLYVYCKENPSMYYDLDGHSSSVPTLVNDGGSDKKNNGGSGKKKGKDKTPTTVSNNGLNFIANMEVGKVDLVLGSNGNIKEIKPTVNNTTIGYGYDLTKDPLGLGIKTAKNISQTTALDYLKRVSNKYAKTIADSKDITSNLNQQQIDALVALRYNVGSLGAIPKLLNDINNKASYSTFKSHIYNYYESIVKKYPNNAQYLDGWKNRTDKILNVYFNGNYGSMPINAVKGVFK